MTTRATPDPWEGAEYRLNEAVATLAERVKDVPTSAIVLGSGLGGFADRVEAPVSIPYGDIPHWPAVGVIGHEGRMVVGRVAGRHVLVLSGRSHYYEHGRMDLTTFAVRAMGRLGVRRLFLTNAAGGINPRFRDGALMVVDDHLNLFGVNPLIGPNRGAGPRFPDMTQAYSPQLRTLAFEVARDRKLALERGVYAGVTGPSYETPAEIRALRALGADAVGMSTVPEVLVARQMGIEVFAVSCIANPAAGMASAAITAEDVVERTARMSGDAGDLLEGMLARLAER